MIRHTAILVSVIFHPLLVVFLLVIASFNLDFYNYFFQSEKSIRIFIVMSFMILVGFPAISTALLSATGMVSGFRLKEREDRVIPLIVCSIFYIWFFINIKNQPDYPTSLKAVSLGTAMGVAGCFFINNFSKVSLHSSAAASFVTGVLLLIYQLKISYIELDLLWHLRVSSIFALFLLILVFGVVATSRLVLKAHSPQDIYGGMWIGILSQLIAFKIYF